VNERERALLSLVQVHLAVSAESGALLEKPPDITAISRFLANLNADARRVSSDERRAASDE
jgi:hypothetical protein